MQRTRPGHFAARGGGRQQPGQTATERLTALITARWGSEGKDSKGRPCGVDLRCPLCLKPKMRICIGDKPDTLTAFCEGCKGKGLRLVKAIWEITEISLSPMKRRDEPELSPQQRDQIIAKMRRSDEYRALSDRAKALIEVIVTAVLDGEPNGQIGRTNIELLQALNTRSQRQVYEAVAGAIASGIVFKRLRSNGYGSGCSNQWILMCLVEAINRRKK